MKLVSLVLALFPLAAHAYQLSPTGACLPVCTHRRIDCRRVDPQLRW